MASSPGENQNHPESPEEKLTDEALQRSGWESLAQAGGLALIGIDTDRKIVIWAGSTDEILGCTADEVQGKDFIELFVPARDTSTLSTLLIEAGQGSCLHSIEQQLLARDGTRHTLLCTLSPLRNAGGDIRGVLFFGQDISSRKKAERTMQRAYKSLEDKLKGHDTDVESSTYDLKKEIIKHEWLEETLRQEQQLLQTFMDNIPEHVYFKDQQSRFTRINQAMANWIGLQNPEAAFGKTDFDFFSEEHARIAYADEQEIMQTGTPVTHRDEQETWKDGRSTWVSTTKLPLYGRDKKIIGTFGISRDVTERVKAEHKLRDTAAELARSNEDLSSFAYIVSHDLQEPLRGISNFGQLMDRTQKENLDAEGREYLDFILSEAGRMSNLIQALLSYSRVGTHGDTFEDTDCNAVLDQALGHLMVAIEENKATIHRDRLPVIKGDYPQLVQLFQNLIGNAIKFRGKNDPEIHVQAEQNDAGWRITVRDNGIGIPPEKADLVFEIFKRLVGRDEYPGTGIGLSVCKRIVERHGGEIHVESAEGGGTAFIFTLPTDPG